MRKFLITLTVVALIVSIFGTGIVVYFDVTTPIPEAKVVSGE